MKPYELNASGLQKLGDLLEDYSPDELVTAMQVAVAQYVKYEGGVPTHESVNSAWSFVAKICNVNRTQRSKPYFKRLLYIRGILRNRLSYCDERLALELLEAAVEAGVDVESLVPHAKKVRNWTEWRRDIEQFINQ